MEVVQNLENKHSGSCTDVRTMEVVQVHAHCYNSGTDAVHAVWMARTVDGVVPGTSKHTVSSYRCTHSGSGTDIRMVTGVDVRIYGAWYAQCGKWSQYRCTHSVIIVVQTDRRTRSRVHTYTQCV